MTDVAKHTPQWSYRFLGLLFLIGECFRLGIAYTPLSGHPEVLPKALQIITAPLPQATDSWHPIWVFGGAWLVCGLVALFAFRRPNVHTFVYVAVTVGLAYWAAAYVVAQIQGNDPRAWFTASGYVLFAFITFVFGHVTRPKRRSDQ